MKDQPDFPVWAAAEQRILACIKKTLTELIRVEALHIDQVQTPDFQMQVPEWVDLFNGSERLVSIMANPIYSRKVFSTGIEYENTAKVL